jgi:hypothetical protein
MSTENRGHTSNGLRREIVIQPSFTEHVLRGNDKTR